MARYIMGISRVYEGRILRLTDIYCLRTSSVETTTTGRINGTWDIALQKDTLLLNGVASSPA
jgi:hypothetical protein